MQPAGISSSVCLVIVRANAVASPEISDASKGMEQLRISEPGMPLSFFINEQVHAVTGIDAAGMMEHSRHAGIESACFLTADGFKGII